MLYLGICQTSGAVYEGITWSAGTRVNPQPLLTPIRFTHSGDICPVNNYVSGYAEMLFREDSFDPITRIRRGRVFTMRTQSNPWNWQLHDPARNDLQQIKFAHGHAQEASLITYQRDLLQEFRKGKGATHLPRAVLGWDEFATFWKIMSIETDYRGTPILTLKALFSLGETPEVVEGGVPTDAIAPLKRALDRVESSVNRLGPIEVIDRCRDALSIVFGAACQDMAKDLSVAISSYVQTTERKQEDMRSWAGRIVARLHSRGKPNEQHAKGIRPPSDEDAQLALGCLRLVLIEFGWAKG